MENEIFPLSEELIVLCSSREALQMHPDVALNAFCSLEKAKDYPSFEWCLKNLHNFQTKEGREFAVKNINDFISSSWHQIPENIYPLLIEELFTKIWQDPNFQDKSYHISIFKTQNLAVYGLYPKYWPDFFDFLLNLPKHILYGFLSSFNYSIHISASTSRRNIDDLLNNCLKDGSQAKILQVIVSDVFEHVEGASDSLVSTVEWVSLSLLLNSDLISLFSQLLIQPETCTTGLNIFISIFHRPIAQDLLFELVTQLQLAEIIHHIATNFEYNEEIVILCSKLLFFAFNKLLPSQNSSLFELITNVTDISMNLYMFPNKESTSFNYRLLMSAFSYYPMLSSEYFSAQITKISSSIALNSPDAESITQTSLRLFFISASTSGIDVVPHLISLTNGLDPNVNIIETATLLAAINSVISSNNDEENQRVLSFSQIFSPLLSIHPPFSPPHFVAMSNYLQLIQPFIREFDPTFRAQIFIKCIELVMCKEIAKPVQNDRNNLLESIFDVCQAIPHLISTIPNIKPMLPSFVQTGEIYLIKSASLIISELAADERIQFYSQILPFFALYLNLSVAPKSEQTLSKIDYDSIISSVLEFWILAKTDDLPELKPALIEFFSSFYSDKYQFLDTEELFPFFCKGSVNALGIDAFPIFWNTAKNITDFESAAVIVSASICLAQSPPYDEKVMLVFQLINKVFGEKNHSSRRRRESDEFIQMRDFYEASANFLMLIIPNLQQNSFEQLTSISHLVNLLSTMNLSNSMMNNVVLIFLENPALAVAHFEQLFAAFMSVLDEFRKLGIEDQKVMLFNLMKLLRILFSIVKDFEWNSSKWQNISCFGNNGPNEMRKVMLAPDDQFEPLAIDFLEIVEPPRGVFEDEFAADAED